jgi:hypothetical protein
MAAPFPFDLILNLVHRTLFIGYPAVRVDRLHPGSIAESPPQTAGRVNKH